MPKRRMKATTTTTAAPDWTASQGGDPNTCHSDNDGECEWEGCPQLRDGEPRSTGRHCPLWIDDPEV